MVMKEGNKIRLAKREAVGKGMCRKLRASGMVPVVFYGPEYKDGIVGTVDEREISTVANSPNWETSMIDLELPGGKEEMVLLRDVQRHVVTRKVMHVDLYQLVQGRKVKVGIPVRVLNKDICAGVKMGGVLEQPFREVEIMVLPREIPLEIVLDAAKMTMGSETCMKDLDLPESAELLSPESAIVLMVSRPKSMLEPSPEDAEEDTEVEVVGKGKRKEE
jgi:large subunit ribosomal protein L25